MSLRWRLRAVRALLVVTGAMVALGKLNARAVLALHGLAYRVVPELRPAPEPFGRPDPRLYPVHTPLRRLMANNTMPWIDVATWRPVSGIAPRFLSTAELTADEPTTAE